MFILPHQKFKVVYWSKNNADFWVLFELRIISSWVFYLHIVAIYTQQYNT